MKTLRDMWRDARLLTEVWAIIQTDPLTTSRHHLRLYGVYRLCVSWSPQHTISTHCRMANIISPHLLIFILFHLRVFLRPASPIPYILLVSPNFITPSYEVQPIIQQHHTVSIAISLLEFHLSHLSPLSSC